MYKSTDGGQTWTFIGLYNAGQIDAIRVSTRRTQTLPGICTGDAFKSNSERGVFKTTDGGQTWRKVLFSRRHRRDDSELQPGNPYVVYAWLSRLERKPWTH